LSRLLTDGLGADTGHNFSLEKPLWLTGRVLYVSSASGDDATTNPQERRDPYATLKAAVDAALAGDIIVLLEDHDEVITVAMTVDVRVRIIGEGRADGVPQAAITCNVAGGPAITVTAENVEFVNIKMKTPSVTGTGARVLVQAADVTFDSIYAECGEFSEEPVIERTDTVDRLTIRDSTFVSTATDKDARPNAAVVASGGTVDMRNVTFDGGEWGWNIPAGGGPFAYDGSVDAYFVRFENISLLNGSDLVLHEDSTGWVSVTTASGGARVRW